EPLGKSTTVPFCTCPSIGWNSLACTRISLPPGRGRAGHRGQSGDTPLDPGSTIRRNVWVLRLSATPPPAARLGLRLFSAQSVPSKLFWQHQLRSLAPVPPPPAAPLSRRPLQRWRGRRWRVRSPASAQR